MRSFIKYLLVLFPILLSGQMLRAVAVEHAAADPVATLHIDSLQRFNLSTEDAQTLKLVPATLLELFYWEAIELLEEDDKWNIGPLQISKENCDSHSLWASMAQYYVQALSPQSPSRAFVEGFHSLLSSCLTFCVLRI